MTILRKVIPLIAGFKSEISIQQSKTHNMSGIYFTRSYIFSEHDAEEKTIFLTNDEVNALTELLEKFKKIKSLL